MKRECFHTDLLLASAAACLVIAAGGSSPAFAETGDDEPSEIERVHRAAEERRERMDRKREELKRQRETRLKSWLEVQKSLQDRADKLGKRTDFKNKDVYIEEVKEPDSPEAVVSKGIIVDPFILCPPEHEIVEHKIWTLRPEDLRVWRPTRIKIERPFAARAPYEVRDLVRQTDRTVFGDVFLAVPFALTNSTDGELVLSPTMTIVSEDLRFTPETGGFIARQDMERTMFRGLESTGDLTGYLRRLPEGGLEPVQAIQAGETRYGAGIFPLPDLELDRMTLIVEGLNNTYRFDRRQKRVLVVEFQHLGDQYSPYRESVEFVGKDWRWLWMWYEEIKISPLDRFEVPTPTGASQRTLWSYQVTLTNSSGETQDLKLREFNTVVPMEVEVSGATVKVEVEFADDGKSTIEKAKVMEELALPFKGDRFFAGALEPDEVKVFPVIFDQNDIVWKNAYEQVERGLIWDETRGRGVSLGYGEAPLKAGMESWLPDQAELKGLIEKLREAELTDEKKAQVRRQVVAKLDGAMERERDRYTLAANVTAESGIASGTYRIVRSYFREGVIEDEWLHKWEE